jgi:hypothetical protein
MHPDVTIDRTNTQIGNDMTKWSNEKNRLNYKSFSNPVWYLKNVGFGSNQFDI